MYAPMATPTRQYVSTGGKRAQELEKNGKEGAAPRAKAIFQVFIDGYDISPTEKGKEKHHNADHGQRHRKLVLKPKQAANGNDECGCAEETVGGTLCRHR